MSKRVKKSKNRTYKGLPLVDATKDLEICVTKPDVTKSRKNDPANCAMAMAAKRETKAAEVEVHISRTYLLDHDKKRWIRFMTPESVSREITSFDRGSTFEIGDYKLKAPRASEKLGHPRKQYKTGPHTTTKEKPIHRTVNIRESAN